MMIKLKGAFIALSIFMVIGVIFSGSAKAACNEGEVRMTTKGDIFTCDTSHASLGEAWRDPAGLIWGDIVKNEDGSVRYMVHSSQYIKEIGRPLPEGQLGAKEYCESIGARLPSGDECARLGGYLESGSGQGYFHPDDNKILPNLTSSHVSHWFWSSSVSPDRPEYAYGYGFFLSDRYAYIIVGPRYSVGAVRCVVAR